MATIHDLILKAAVDFELQTGKKPTNAYLGEAELKALLQWARENDYISGSEPVNIEGDSRAEVNGLFIFSVNAPAHLMCA